MNTTYTVIIVLVLLIIFYFAVFQYSYLNTRGVQVDGEEYQVHRKHHDPEGAAKLLDEIVSRNKILVSHLRNKYTKSNVKNSINPDKENRIDVIPYDKNFAMEDAIMEQIGYLNHEIPYLSNRVIQLMNNYNIDKIYEISPLNPSGSTSYTENKGEKLVLCLRQKKPNGNKKHEFHDINTIMFVVLHELTHIMNDKWGHKEQYWRMFKFVVLNAVEAGIYEPVNYSKDPIIYCGMEITYNPFYDVAL
jgi:WLM domain